MGIGKCTILVPWNHVNFLLYFSSVKHPTKLVECYELSQMQEINGRYCEVPTKIGTE